MFPYGSRGTSVVDLAVKVFHNTNINASTQLECVNCQFTDEPVEDELSFVIFNASEGITSTRDQLRQTLVCESDASCPECLMPLKQVTSYYNVPNILLFSVGGQKISVSKHIKIRTVSGSKMYQLKGLVYHGAFHFTSRMVTSDGSVWFHDGQLGANCWYEKILNEFTENGIMQVSQSPNVTSGICSRLSWTCSCHAAAMALSSK